MKTFLLYCSRFSFILAISFPLIIVANIFLGLLLGRWNWGNYWGVDQGDWIGFWATVLSILLAAAGIAYQLRANEDMQRRGREGSALERLLETTWILSTIEEKHARTRSSTARVENNTGYENTEEWRDAYNNFKSRLEAWRMHSGHSAEMTGPLRRKMDELVVRLARGDASLSAKVDYRSKSSSNEEVRSIPYREVLRQTLTYTVRRLSEALPCKEIQRQVTLSELVSELEYQLNRKTGA